MKHYNYILFDWDGCLAHTLPIWTKAWHRTFKKLGYDISLERIVELYFRNHGDVGKDNNLDVDKFFRITVADVLENNTDVILQDHALELLKRLYKSDKRIALVTSSTREVIDNFFDQLDLRKYFDAVLAWEDTEKNKPHPEPIYKALELLEGKKEEAIMIGDSGADIQAAQAAGITSVWYFPEENKEVYVEDQYAHLGPDYTFHHLKEFEELIFS